MTLSDSAINGAAAYIEQLESTLSESDHSSGLTKLKDEYQNAVSR